MTANSKTNNHLGDGHQLVGVLFQQRESDLLNLLALSLGVSKSDVVRDAVSEKLPDDDQIRTIILKIAHDKVQEYLHHTVRHYTFFSFKEDLSKKFQLKGVSRLYIDRILKEATRLYEANKKTKRSSKRGTQTAEKRKGQGQRTRVQL